MFENVVIGVDNYERGRDAIRLAQALASRDGVLDLVYVELLQSD